MIFRRSGVGESTAVFEHPADDVGGDLVGVLAVANEGFSDGFQEDKSRPARDGLLVAGQKFDEPLGGQVVGDGQRDGKPAEKGADPFDAVGIGKTHLLFNLKDGGNTDGNRLAVQESISGGRFDGVADGVAVVEQSPLVGFGWISLDDGSLDAAIESGDLFEAVEISGQDGVKVLFEESEVAGVGDQGVLDGLDQSRAELAVVQCGQRGDIDINPGRVVEGAEGILG